MVKNSIKSFLISISLLIPSVIHGQEIGIPVTSHAEQINKAAKITGYGAIATIGGGLVVLGGGAAFGQYTDRFQKSNRFKKLAHFLPKKDIRSLGLSIAAMLLGTGMVWYGARGLKKTIDGQTSQEEQSEKEQIENIKETIKETLTQAGKAVFDISKQAVRVTGYSISAAIGSVALLVGLWHWGRAIIPHRKTPFKQIVKEWKKDERKFVGYCIIFPLGTTLLMFGIHGLNKEYQSFKKSEVHKNSDTKIKEKVDVAVQTDISHLEEKENI